MFRRLGLKSAQSLIVGALAFVLGIGFAVAEDKPSTSTIIKSLTPQKTLTRGLSAPAAKTSAEDEAFIEGLRKRKTRSLSPVELDKVATIAEDKPKIDLEIQFELNSDRISRAAESTVEALGKALSDSALKGNTFILAGHADALGDAEYNQSLSERRAAAVKRFLVQEYDIPEDRLVAVGYGKTRLKNKKDPYAAENRRVAVINMDDSQTAKK
jgi:outer membrane protein OmpA-like peptidoglycan-associated protein